MHFCGRAASRLRSLLDVILQPLLIPNGILLGEKRKKSSVIDRCLVLDTQVWLSGSLKITQAAVSDVWPEWRCSPASPGEGARREAVPWASRSRYRATVPAYGAGGTSRGGNGGSSPGSCCPWHGPQSSAHWWSRVEMKKRTQERINKKKLNNAASITWCPCWFTLGYLAVF